MFYVHLLTADTAPCKPLFVVGEASQVLDALNRRCLPGKWAGAGSFAGDFASLYESCQIDMCNMINFA